MIQMQSLLTGKPQTIYVMTYIGNPFNDALVNINNHNDVRSWAEECLHTLEGGNEAFYERRDIYESKNN